MQGCPTPNSTNADGAAIFDAAASSIICPQFADPPFTVAGFTQSEDCLNLHVATPEAALNGTISALPVLVFLHGGDLTFGGGAQQKLSFWAANAAGKWAPSDAVDPSGMAVTVAVTYRLGLLGFMSVSAFTDASPHDGVSANFGFTDQTAALEWIQRNIAAFGGDPSRVTVVGQSSGATSIYGLLTMPRAVGLFGAVVALSGSPNITMPLAIKQAQDQPIVDTLGCGGQASANDTVACLQALTWGQIRDATPASWALSAIGHISKITPPSGGGQKLIGIVTVDGAVMSSSLATAMATGVQPSSAPYAQPSPYARAPPPGDGRRNLIVSHMGQEFNIAPFPTDLFGMNRTDPAWMAKLKSDLEPGWGARAADVATAVDAEYSANVTYALLEYDTIAADFGVACGYRMLAEAAAESSAATANAGVVSPPPRVFLMQNFWPPQAPDNGGAMSFAFHAWDWWAASHQFKNILPDFKPYVPAAEDLAFSDALRALWYQLASRSTSGSAASAGAWEAPMRLTSDAEVHPSPAGEETVWHALSNASAPDAVLIGRADRYPYVGTATTPNVAAWEWGAQRCRVLAEYGLDFKGNWWSN